MIFNPHRYTLEEGGMKQTDAVQLAFKRETDPQGLLNPGKMIAFEDPSFDFASGKEFLFPGLEARAARRGGMTPMRILVLFAHPVETSFGAAVHAKAVATLKARGHEIDDCDLYAEDFDPVMSRQDRIDYHDVSINRGRVDPYVDRLLAAEAICLSFPVWNMGFPAILKGFVDKVFLPGVSFNMRDNGDYVPRLHNIKRVGVACTYGGARWRTFLRRPAPPLLHARDACSLRARRPCDYIASYDMNHTTQRRRAAFLAKVERRLSRW